MATNDVTETTKNAWDTAKEKVKDSVSNSGEQIAKSSKDWLGYVEKHPLQTLLFGVIGYFALRGLLKG